MCTCISCPVPSRTGSCGCGLPIYVSFQIPFLYTETEHCTRKHLVRSSSQFFGHTPPRGITLPALYINQRLPIHAVAVASVLCAVHIGESR